MYERLSGLEQETIVKTRHSRLMAFKPQLADFDRSLLGEQDTTPLFEKPVVRRYPRWHRNGSWH
jgi:hypothetical protein